MRWRIITAGTAAAVAITEDPGTVLVVSRRLVAETDAQWRWATGWSAVKIGRWRLVHRYIVILRLCTATPRAANRQANGEYPANGILMADAGGAAIAAAPVAEIPAARVKCAAGAVAESHCLRRGTFSGDTTESGDSRFDHLDVIHFRLRVTATGPAYGQGDTISAYGIVNMAGIVTIAAGAAIPEIPATGVVAAAGTIGEVDG